MLDCHFGFCGFCNDQKQNKTGEKGDREKNQQVSKGVTRMKSDSRFMKEVLREMNSRPRHILND